MPYLVLTGAKMTVTRADGRITGHVAKHDTVFRDGETVQKGQPYCFEKDGFKLTVDTADVKEIVFTCSNCRGVVEEEGLCAECEKLRKPP